MSRVSQVLRQSAPVSTGGMGCDVNQSARLGNDVELGKMGTPFTGGLFPIPSRHCCQATPRRSLAGGEQVTGPSPQVLVVLPLGTSPGCRTEPGAAPVQLIVRRVKPRPGSQLALFATYGFQGFINERYGEGARPGGCPSPPYRDREGHPRAQALRRAEPSPLRPLRRQS